MEYCASYQTIEPAAPSKKGGLFEAEIEAQLPDEEEVKDCGEINSGKAGTALIVPLWFASGFHHAMLSALNQEEEYEALNFVAAWSLGQRAYSIPTLGLPPLSQIIAHGVTTARDNDRSKRDAPSWLPTAASTYATLKRIGELSEEILSKLPPVEVEKVAADIHVVPKFCKGLSVLYTSHKSSPCTCRAVEVIAETSRKGIGKPLSIKPVKKVLAATDKDKNVAAASPIAIQSATADRTEKKFSVADRLKDVLSFMDSKYKKKVPIEIDSEYTRSTDSLKILISGGWEFTTRIRRDSLIGKEVRDHMESNKLDLFGKWYNNQEYGGDLQIIGRRITRHNSNKIILYLSTRKNLSAQQVIDERSTRWRIENLFKNVNIDSTPGNNVSEITGYYTLAFFMAELSIAFKATTKTVGLIMNREGTIKVEGGVMKIHLKNLDRRLLSKITEYTDYINSKLSCQAVKIQSNTMPR